VMDAHTSIPGHGIRSITYRPSSCRSSCAQTLPERLIPQRRPMPDQSQWPAHLRDDAPFKTCDTCGRKTWATEARTGDPCAMPQPSGVPCEGHFTRSEADALAFRTYFAIPAGIESPPASDEERYARCTACGYTGDRVFKRDNEGLWRDVLGGETGVTPDHCVCSHCGGRPFEMVTARPSRETQPAKET
jgi:ribosomal protein L37E